MTKDQVRDVYNKFAVDWQTRASQDITHAYIEKPAMLANVDPLDGKSVLCVGAGDGREVQLISELKPARIMGTDISEELVTLAREAYPDVPFEVGDLETLELDEQFDVIWGSFVMHYFEDWSTVLSNVTKLLKPGGQFLFSIPHPIKYSLESVKDEKSRSNILGYRKNKEDKGFEILGNYIDHTEHKIEFSENLHVTVMNVPLGERVNSIISSELQLEKLLEPKPIKEMELIAKREFEIRSKIPSVAVFSLRKPAPQL